MPFVDTSRLDVIERLPRWHGRYFRSTRMTFAHYDFVRGAFIHEHFHPQEEVYEVIEGDRMTDVPRYDPDQTGPDDLGRTMREVEEWLSSQQPT